MHMAAPHAAALHGTWTDTGAHNGALNLKPAFLRFATQLRARKGCRPANVASMIVPYVYKEQSDVFTLRARDGRRLVFPLRKTPTLELHAGTVWDASFVLSEWANARSEPWTGVRVLDLRLAGRLALCPCRC